MNTGKATSEPQSAPKQPKVVANAALALPVPLASRLGNLQMARVLQAKLTVNAPGDIYEQEADRVADQVMRMPANRDAPHVEAAPPSVVQRACSCEEEIRRQPADEELQRSRTQDGAHDAPAVSAGLESYVNSLEGRGQSLAPSEQSFMGSRLGADFSSVRVHRDAEADAAARAAGANAFTVRQHVVFRAGQYAPGTESGTRLLAHELTHVIQQGQGGSVAIQRQPNDELPSASSIARAEAAFGRGTLSGGTSSGLHNLGTGSYIDGTPLSPAEWLRDYRKGKIRVDEGSVLRFLSSGEIVTTPSLISWAVDQKVPQSQLLNEIRSRHTFAGSPEAHENAVMALTLALRKNSLGDLRKERDQTRIEKRQKEKNEQEQAERKRKAVVAHAEALVVADHRHGLASAMDSLRRAGPDSEMRDIYLGMRVLRETNDQTWHPGMDRGFNDPLRASIAKRLQLHGLDTPEFEKRVHHFEEAFCAATKDLAFSALDSAHALGVHYLDEMGALEKLARALTRRLDPVREPLVSELDHAADLRRESYSLSAADTEGMSPELQAMAFEKQQQADETKQFALALAKSALHGLPFVNLPEFPLQEIVRAKQPHEVREQLYSYLNQYLKAIEETRESLVQDPRRIYKLDVLFEAARRKFGIARGSLFELILEYAKKDAAAVSWLRKLETILVFALLVASIVVPGGALATVAVVSGAASGIRDAWEAVQQYEEDRAAYRVGLQSVDPSLLWVVVSLIGAGLAVGGAVALLRTGALRAALESFNRARRALSKSALGDLARALRGLPPKLRRAILGRARGMLKPGTYGNPARQLTAAAQTEAEAAEAAVAEASQPSLDVPDDFDVPTSPGVPDHVVPPVSNDLPAVEGELPSKPPTTEPASPEPGIVVDPDQIDPAGIDTFGPGEFGGDTFPGTPTPTGADPFADIPTNPGLPSNRGAPPTARGITPEEAGAHPMPADLPAPAVEQDLGPLSLPVSNPLGQIAELTADASLVGTQLVLNDLTLLSVDARYLLNIGRQLLSYAQRLKAVTIRLRGTIIGRVLKANYGGGPFDITIPATREGLMKLRAALKGRKR